MRKTFAETLIRQSVGSDCFFLTGDLGFMALEGVRDALGNRFINCGVAEQNMIGMAAGLAREGMRVFAYSIAPFCYARPFEQIRNDLALTGLPVCLVGNGGGYAYGHMGPTHHALEDCAAMCALGVRVLAPAFNEDIAPMLALPPNGPCYLRLGYDVRPKTAPVPEYASWRCVLPGKKGVIAALGPMAGLAWSALAELDEKERPAVWAVTELPLAILPEPFCQAIGNHEPLIILEEHVKAGGLGMQLVYALAAAGISPVKILHRYALGYPSGRYGSQTFHRKECGMDIKAIRHLVQQNS